MNTLVYYSKSHNTERFVDKVLKKKDFTIHRITNDNKDNLIVNEPYIILSPTFGFGQVPIEVITFLDNNKENLKGVMSSGNRNWGANFANSGKIISERYNTTLIGRYELAGMQSDVDKLIKYMEG